jgi:phosphatidylinositol dimannoside acyltransferase
LDIQEIINGRIGVGLGYALGQMMPPSLGESLAVWAGKFLAARKGMPMVRAARTNQWVVSGESLRGESLDAAVAETFSHTALSIYRFYRSFKNPEAMRKQVIFPEKLKEIIQETLDSKRGLIVTGVHLGNFDLVLQSIAQQVEEGGDLKWLALGVPQPGKGYELQNDFRRQNGVKVIPASMAAIKAAAQMLDEGGIVVSGLDRPIPEAKYRPHFFGRPASVPVLHIPLALRAKAPVVVTGSILKPDGAHQIFISDYLMMKSYDSRQEEIVFNAEAVLEIAEGYIKQAPHQWAMFYPVWPEALDETPG